MTTSVIAGQSVTADMQVRDSSMFRLVSGQRPAAWLAGLAYRSVAQHTIRQPGERSARQVLPVDLSCCKCAISSARQATLTGCAQQFWHEAYCLYCEDVYACMLLVPAGTARCSWLACSAGCSCSRKHCSGTLGLWQDLTPAGGHVPTAGVSLWQSPQVPDQACC